MLRAIVRWRREPAHLRLGRAGEVLAVRYLRRNGYRVRARNVRLGRDEIDIVAIDLHERVTVFVEVKTRAWSDPDFPAEMNASWRKIRRTLRAARSWVAAHDYSGGYRVDLICVEAGRVVSHYKELGWGQSG